MVTLLKIKRQEQMHREQQLQHHQHEHYLAYARKEIHERGKTKRFQMEKEIKELSQIGFRQQFVGNLVEKVSPYVYIIKNFDCYNIGILYGISHRNRIYLQNKYSCGIVEYNGYITISGGSIIKTYKCFRKVCNIMYRF